MQETVRLYKPPHAAVGDHLMALDEVANVIGLYDRASELTRAALRPNHGKTAMAHLNLALIHKELDQYDLAQHQFHLACNVLQFDPNLDKEWFERLVKDFLAMQQRARAEKQFEAMIENMRALLSERKLLEADQVAREAATTLSRYFPPDHYHFVLLYKRHSQILRIDGREVAAEALFHLSNYLERKLNDKHEYNKTMDKQFPPFPQEVQNLLLLDEN